MKQKKCITSSNETSITSTQVDKFVHTLQDSGWRQIEAGLRSTFNYNTRIVVLQRICELNEVITENVNNSKMGYPVNQPIELSDFKSYPSLMSIRESSRQSLCIAFDSECYYPSGSKYSRREMLTWQFALVYNGFLIEFMFVKSNPNYMLTLEYAIGRILDSLPIKSTDVRTVRKYWCMGKKSPKSKECEKLCFDTKKEALEHSVEKFEDGKSVHTSLEWKGIEHIRVNLICHTGKFDLSTLNRSGVYQRDFLINCSEVQKGIVTMDSIFIYPDSVNPKYSNNSHKYPLMLHISDILCHAPSKKRSLKNLGKAIGLEKIELSNEVKSHMDELFCSDPVLFAEYATNDAIITLLYAASLYGYNHTLPVTITSATAVVLRRLLEEYLGTANKAEFERIYRGLHKVSKGKELRPDNLSFIENTNWEAISLDAYLVQYMAQQSYIGGYNGCSEVGFFRFLTFDYDICNAYPTAMCLCCDIDWENPIVKKIEKQYITLEHFRDPETGKNEPLLPILAYVRFEFPKSVKYPTIPIPEDGMPIFTRTSNGVDGVYAAGPEIYIALQLGAKVYCENGMILRPLRREDSSISYSLRYAVKQLVADRLRASGVKKDSIEEKILKEMVNSGYGKAAQSVKDKTKWNAAKNEMEKMKGSSITNPVLSTFITSIIRATLLAAQNQITEQGYFTCSVTTDGLITNCPEDVMKSLDLYGLRECLEAARLFLTDGNNPEIWQIKHVQDELLNFCTRGNIALYNKDTTPYIYNGKKYSGVCAHNNASSGFESDSDEDRKWLMGAVLTRTGKVAVTEEIWPSFRDIVQGKEFIIKEQTHGVRMDFDFKRKPIRESFVEDIMEYNGKHYKIARFDTASFEDVNEFRKYRKVNQSFECLRTMEDWERFWFKLNCGDTDTRIKIDSDWSVLMSCVMGHKAGLWNIPDLDRLSGAARIEWIQAHNTSTKTFKESDWKNCGRKERWNNILPREMLTGKLEELGCSIKKL